jgi:hypothetical protein
VRIGDDWVVRTLLAFGHDDVPPATGERSLHPLLRVKVVLASLDRLRVPREVEQHRVLRERREADAAHEHAVARWRLVLGGRIARSFRATPGDALMQVIGKRGHTAKVRRPTLLEPAILM